MRSRSSRPPRRDEGDALHHQAADEVNVTAETVQFGNDDRSRAWPCRLDQACERTSSRLRARACAPVHQRLFRSRPPRYSASMLKPCCVQKDLIAACCASKPRPLRPCFGFDTRDVRNGCAHRIFVLPRITSDRASICKRGSIYRMDPQIGIHFLRKSNLVVNDSTAHRRARWRVCKHGAARSDQPKNSDQRGGGREKSVRKACLCE